MLKKISLFISLLCVMIQVKAQSEFKLYRSYRHADINYLTIKNINDIPHGYSSMMKQFEPVKGEYDVYIFIKEFKGTSYLYVDSDNEDSLVVFHDMILLKTNKNKEIVDGFYYRLEWSELPSQYMLFRSFSQSTILRDGLEVELLNFLNEYEMYQPLEFSEYESINEFGQRYPKEIEKDKLKF